MEYYVHGHKPSASSPPQISTLRFKFPVNLAQKASNYWDFVYGTDTIPSPHAPNTLALYPNEHAARNDGQEPEEKANCCLKKIKQYGHNVRQAWLRFCSTTTGHGLARTIDDREYAWVRWLWALFLLALFGFLLASVTQSSINVWINRSLHSELSQVTNDTMFYPDIHICDTSIFNRSRLLEMGFNDTMSTYLALALTVTAPAHVFRLNRTRRLAFASELEQMTKPYGGVNNVLQRAALSCTEMILACIRLTIRLSGPECCKQFFDNQTELNIMGTCVSTNGQPQIQEFVPSQSLGFVVYLRVNVDHRVEFDMSIVTPTVPSRSGIVFAVSDPISDLHATLPAYGQYVSPGNWAAIPISITKIDNSELKDSPLSPTQCIHADDPDAQTRAPGFKSYSKMNCRAAGVQYLVETSLNCTIMSVPSTKNLAKCSPEALVGYFSGDSPKKLKEYEDKYCLVDCVVYNYDSKVSTAKLELPEAIAGGWDDRIAVGLHFFFPSFTYTININHPESFVKWLGDIGGNMGFYMGASVVTIIEILVLVVKCIIVSWYRDPSRIQVHPSSAERRQRSVRPVVGPGHYHLPSMTKT